MQKLDHAFQNPKIECGLQIIDIPDDIDCSSILSYVFFKNTVHIDKDDGLIVGMNENSRYFGNNAKCYNCGTPGHVSRDCPNQEERVCSYCGINHQNEQCQFILCSNCSFLGHFEKNCRERSREASQCTRCTENRHDMRECTVKWRKYNISAKLNPNIIRSCPLCLSDKHFMDDCEYALDNTTVFSENYKSYVLSDNNIRDNNYNNKDNNIHSSNNNNYNNIRDNNGTDNNKNNNSRDNKDKYYKRFLKRRDDNNVKDYNIRENNSLFNSSAKYNVRDNHKNISKNRKYSSKNNFDININDLNDLNDLNVNDSNNTNDRNISNDRNGSNKKHGKSSKRKFNN